MQKTIIRIFDILIALVSLPFAALAFVLILVPQLVIFKGIFYFSERIGKDNKKFIHVKLRSMRGRNETAGRHDPSGSRAHLEKWRIPVWGCILRKTHLDEIPEIFFILIGAESFVGPRPLLPAHAALVDTGKRQAQKPGWTGYSQVFLKTRGILPSRIQRRLDMELGEKLTIGLYFRLLFASFFARKKRRLMPGDDVIAYRQKITGHDGEPNG